MLNRVIDLALDHRWITLTGLAVVIAVSLYLATHIPIDAFPDLTNNQVVILTESPGLSPVEVEQSVTFPIESALMGLPSTQGVRSMSKLGLSMVTVIFEDHVNTYFARQVVNERIQEIRSRLPEGLEPTLGPVATAFGEVFQYTVEGAQHTLMDRKALHDWQIRHLLRTVPGVNEVNTWGGEARQYTIEVNPADLRRYGLTLRDVFQRLRDNNRNFGGGFIEHASEQYTVRGLGRTRNLEDVGGIVLSAHEGTPVLVRDVARLYVGSVQRQGAVSRDGVGETVSGMTIMLKGENGMRVIEGVKERLRNLRLPEGVRLAPFYDQSEVIKGTIQTVTRNLTEAGALVVAVLLVFLGNVRAALIVAAVIPISLLFGFIGMAVFGVSANLMSLGAIDFGMVVDGSVVMMENSIRRIAHENGRDRLEVIREAAHEVARPIVFGIAIIIAVYIPIFTLEDLEGRMFRPMAITVTSLLFGSLILAMTVVPVLASFTLRGRIEEKEGWFARVRAVYRRSLELAFRARPLVVILAALAVIAAVASVPFIGTEFMPRLDEGSVLITTRKLPGISLTESVKVSRVIEQTLMSFPEVRGVVTKLGRPDLATEAMGVYEGDVYVLLKPKEQWTTAHNKEDLVGAMSARLERIPGVEYNFTQPMAMRLDEVVSGIKADVALKIFGDDSSTLERLAESAHRILAAVPGAADAQAEAISGVPELRVSIDRGALARYGLDVSDVQDVVDSASGGQLVSEMVEDQRRFPIAVRLPAHYRNDLLALGDVVLQSRAHELVRLNQVAHLTLTRGPELVSREGARRRIVVQANVRGRDLGGFVSDAQQKINAQLSLPPGYEVTWGGQFENQARASRRLMVVLPVSILVIFGLLFAAFRSTGQALLILLNVPFALVGGIGALWLREMNLNVSASIGFIALFGVAVLNGVVMVSYINRLRQSGMEMNSALLDGASLRLRPVLMTALVASLGFIPMAVSQAAGAEVQRPLATVVIGGLATSTILTMYVLPLLYPWFSRYAASLKRPDISPH